MSFAPYLTFDGTCAEAMRFYAETFGASDLQIMTYAEAPPGGPMPDAPQDQVMHSQFTLGTAVLMAADAPPGMYSPQAGVSVYHAAADTAAAKGIFDLLAAGGGITLPFGPTFWSPGFGMLKDRFGTHWIITTPDETQGT